MRDLPETAAPRPAREPGQAKYWAYRAAAAVVPRMPAAVTRLAAELAGLATWALATGARRRVDANLAHIPALAADPERRRTAVRGVFRTAALNYLDQFRVPYLSDAAIAATWEVGRADLFEAAVARGRGIILLTAHMGAFEHAGARTGLLGVPLTLPMERLKPAALFELACALRCHHGIRAIPADSPATVRELYAALKRGEGVILAIDRDVLGTGIEVPFFGEPARLPIGPAILARRSGATMLWASGVRGPGGRSRGAFVEVELDWGAGADGADDGRDGDAAGRAGRPRGHGAIARALRPVVRLLEEQIAAHPDQWVAALAPIWGEAPPPSEAEVAAPARAARR